MERRSSPELVLSLLLTAALCLEAHIDTFVLYINIPKNWTEARLHCQREHIDLATLDVVGQQSLVKRLSELQVTDDVWMGLYRETNSLWKWINLKSGEGSVQDEPSQSILWGLKQQSLCAIVDKDLMWHSVKCSDRYGFYCSVKDTLLYYTDKLTWSGASDICKEQNGELATITQENTNELSEAGWIGLSKDLYKSWSWTGNNQIITYNNWAPGEPLTDDCASFDSTKLWYSNVCSKNLPFICYDDNLVVVKENKTWEDALEYCRKMGRPCNKSLSFCDYDLLNLTNTADYKYVQDRIYRATTDEVWLGLRFLGGDWWWLNGEKARQQERLPACPSNGRHCGAMSKHDTNGWIIRDCAETRNFICYAELEEQ